MGEVGGVQGGPKLQPSSSKAYIPDEVEKALDAIRGAAIKSEPENKVLLQLAQRFKYELQHGGVTEKTRNALLKEMEKAGLVKDKPDSSEGSAIKWLAEDIKDCKTPRMRYINEKTGTAFFSKPEAKVRNIFDKVFTDKAEDRSTRSLKEIDAIHKKSPKGLGGKVNTTK